MPVLTALLAVAVAAAGCAVDYEICGDHRACPGRAACVDGKCVDKRELPGFGEGEGEGEGEGDGGGGAGGSEGDGGEGEGEAPAPGGEGEGEGEGGGEGEGEGDEPLSCEGKTYLDPTGAQVPMGLPCSGRGVCPPGIVECDPSTGNLRCSSFPGGIADASGPEACDRLDNDCNGVVDNGCDTDGDDYCGVPPPGVDPPGPEVCALGPGDCDDIDPSVHPGASERCNARDDDCDGAADEGFDGLGEECRVGLGVCERVGVRRCAPDGQGLSCSVVPGVGRAEVCNGLDDDCDGNTDQAWPTVGQACGACNEGVIRCSVGGQDVCCSATPGCDPDLVPGQERCDDLDNDCDGQLDEGFPEKGVPCSVGVGACERSGAKVCNEAGDGVVCGVQPGEPNPAGELCGNGLDDDCDGQAEEDLRLGEPCESGFGPCARQGIRICDPSGLVLCTAQAAQPEGPERCANDVDDDCDGLVDEGFRTGQACERGQGACRRQGVMACSADGLAAACSAAPGPAGMERCGNRLDDDCDGEIDEGFQLGTPCFSGLGLCARQGRSVCAADGRQVCDARPGPALREVCGNQQDDDCDGEVDEGFNQGQPCTVGRGVCARVGEGYCAAEDPLTPHCTATPGEADPAGEICGDGQDNDCDGETDEGFDLGQPCAVGIGACTREGSYVCAREGAGKACNVEPGPPSQEICGNDVDEDCDGQVDNGFALGGQCFAGDGVCRREGVFRCAEGGAANQCDAEPGAPLAEVCGNDRDDDCDGETDEGFDLATDAQNCGACNRVCNLANSTPVCQDGQCVLGDCFEGYTNTNGRIDDGCEEEIPLLRFLQPQSGRTFGGIAVVRVQMTGMRPGTAVIVDVNRDEIGRDANAPYEVPFDTRQWPEVEVTIRARADDGRNRLEASIRATIDNTAPALAVLDPAPDAVIATPFDVRVDVVDAGGVASVTVDVDGEEAGVALEPPWTVPIDPFDHPPGPREITVTAVDLVGNTRQAVVPVRYSYCEETETVAVGGFLIYKYEASRSDAVADDDGDDVRIACSQPGVLPWSGLTRGAADAACAEAGFRLCTTAEWLRACEGDPVRNYPYGQAYDEDVCNGGDVRLGRAARTGEFDACVSQDGVADLSGNVWEWIADGEGFGPAPGYHVRGGAYTSGLNTLRCQGNLQGVGPASHARVIGFRCCRNAP